MIRTLISNNCMGGCILHENNCEFCTPTISVQILPEEFPRFCKYLKYYMEAELKDYREVGRSITDVHRKYLTDFYGEIPPHPMGIIDDIVFVFQHESNFDAAKLKWDRRKKRVDYDNIGYLFMVINEKYKRYAEKFVALGLPNSVVLTEGFDIEGGHRYDVPEGYTNFDLVDGKRVITQNFDIQAFLEGGYA